LGFLDLRYLLLEGFVLLCLFFQAGQCFFYCLQVGDNQLGFNNLNIVEWVDFA